MKHPAENTILVVNDIPDQLELMSLRLEQAGYRVFTAPDGHEGFQVARREHPRLIISDVSMPRASGIDLCRLVRVDATLRTTPILLVSALRIDTASVVEGLHAGADDYLQAPYDPVYLMAKVGRLVERARMVQALHRSEERFRSLVESVQDYAILMLDAQGRVVSWNEGAARLKGYAAEEIIGEHFSRFYLPEDIEQGKPERELRVAAEQGRYGDEARRVRKDGSSFWSDVVITPLRDEASVLLGFSHVTRDITERKMAEERLTHAAFHDPLTGLPNRALFIDHLKRCIALTKRHDDYLFAVMFLDLDRFKFVNDSLGHVAADQLLVAIARGLVTALRPEDTVARMGGDEFAILLEDIKDISDATRIAERIQKDLLVPFSVDGHEVFTTASIGIALSSGVYDHPGDCLRDADTAMYRAKALGKGRHEIFDQKMHIRVMALLKLEADLRCAIERREFRVHYQPIMSLSTGRLTGFEALVRWEHPHRGTLAPAEFIVVAEETGMIIPIGLWVMHEACRQMREWQEQSSAAARLSINVNLSSKQVSQADLVESVDLVLRETNLEAHRLKLEITESVIMENADSAAVVLSQLKDLGVKLHIDDFGTGYSSLSYLHSFPVDTLKIDRSFIGRMSVEVKNLEIVRTIIQLAHNLHMEVTAEGVETAVQLDQLKGLECEYGQGYFFSQPMNAQSVGAWIMQ